MQDESPVRGSINLRLFQIPISIHPISWLMLGLLGGGLSISSADDLAGVLFFVVAGMLCFIVHELGHALTGRALTGGTPSITIAGLGGMTCNPRPPRTRAGYFAYVFAGPLASFLLGIVAGLAFGLQLGDIGMGLQSALLIPLPIDPGQDYVYRLSLALHESGLSDAALQLYMQLFTVCLWWTVFNLLPIFPLDGGRLLGTLLNNDRLACVIGLIFGSILCLLCLLWAMRGGSLFNVLIVGYLTYINYSVLKQLR